MVDPEHPRLGIVRQCTLNFCRFLKFFRTYLFRRNIYERLHLDNANSLSL